jgi:hypothetical protein
MPRTGLLDLSLRRAELDQRSREARLRLEYVERLLVVRPLRQQSLLRRFLRRLGSRVCSVRQIGGRSAAPMVSAGRERDVSGEAVGGAGGFSAVPPAGWPNCSRIARMSDPRFDRPRTGEIWRLCERGELNL